MSPEDYRELSRATYIALLDCKLAKMDYKSTLAVKGRFLDGHPYPIPFTERELKSKRMISEARLRHCELLFRALWKARRRAQQEKHITIS